MYTRCILASCLHSDRRTGPTAGNSDGPTCGWAEGGHLALPGAAADAAEGVPSGRRAPLQPGQLLEHADLAGDSWG